jgi:hypothetical protein
VRRRDGSKIPMSKNVSWKEEFVALWQHYKLKRVRSVPKAFLTQTDSIPDLACFGSFVLQLFLWWCHGHLPIIALLSQGASAVVLARP